MRRTRTLHTTGRTSTVPQDVARVWDVLAGATDGPHWHTDAVPFRARGLLDRALGGHRPTPPPGRPHLRRTDRVGFWDVVTADAARHRLVLHARVRAPGRVRLEATAVALTTGGTEVGLAISFEPDGLLGRAYLLADLGAREAVAELAMLHLLTELRLSAREENDRTA